MAVVGAAIAPRRKLDDAPGEVLGHGVPGPSAAVVMEERSRPLPAVRGLEPLDRASRQTEHQRSLGDRELSCHQASQDERPLLLPRAHGDVWLFHGRTACVSRG